MPKYIRSLTIALPLIGDKKTFYVGVNAKDYEDKLLKIGFIKPFEDGQTILPNELGKFSEFNSNGKEVKRKDLPMTKESRMIYTSWHDWHGTPHSGVVVREFDKYQRDNIPAPEENLAIRKVGDQLLVTSMVKKLTYKSDSADDVIHVINLFLELFGTFNIYDESFIPSLKIKRLNWDILPKGEFPWEKVKDSIKPVLARLNSSDKGTIEHRLKIIAKYKPDLLAIGMGGFTGYFVFGFSEKNIYVLESTKLDNATYILDTNWEHLSQLTKKDIISSKLHKNRLIHNKTWQSSLARVFKN